MIPYHDALHFLSPADVTHRIVFVHHSDVYGFFRLYFFKLGFVIDINESYRHPDCMLLFGFSFDYYMNYACY